MFKPGDRIICVDNYNVENELDLYKIYTVTRSASGWIYEDEFIEVHEAFGNESYLGERFILATKENLLLYGK